MDFLFLVPHILSLRRSLLSFCLLLSRTRMRQHSDFSDAFGPLSSKRRRGTNFAAVRRRLPWLFIALLLVYGLSFLWGDAEHARRGAKRPASTLAVQRIARTAAGPHSASSHPWHAAHMAAARPAPLPAARRRLTVTASAPPRRSGGSDPAMEALGIKMVQQARGKVSEPGCDRGAAGAQARFF